MTTICCCAGRPAAAGSPPGYSWRRASDAEAYYVRHLLANGFGAELLRTYAMTKRFAAHTTGLSRDADDDRAGPPRRVDDDTCRRRVQIGWWRTTIDGDAPDHLDRRQPGARHDRSTMADLVSGLGGAIVDVVAPETAAATRAPRRCAKATSSS